MYGLIKLEGKTHKSFYACKNNTYIVKHVGRESAFYMDKLFNQLCAVCFFPMCVIRREAQQKDGRIMDIVI